ncbi:MAG TPA: class I SAM-dependent methyltransferase [Ignavibacteria bacterium]|nr:class I SAM-dependent methyltransferase [Ignavibacteria bacterium]
MFIKSAKFYDALYHFKDYKAASEKLHKLIQEYNPSAKSLLDTACGTGKHIEHLQHHYEVEGLDINEELIGIAKERCPDNVYHIADISNFSLNRKFDVITCLFSSIAYVKTEEKLFSSVNYMSRHLNGEGLVIIEPWFSKETFRTGTITANHYDEKDLKITWMYTSEIENEMSVLDIHYLVGTPEEVTFFNERHEIGLFDDSQYRKAFTEAGLEVTFDKEGLFGRGMYIGIKN